MLREGKEIWFLIWMAVWAVADLRERKIGIFSVCLVLLSGIGWQLAAGELLRWDTALGLLIGGIVWIFCCLSGEQMGKGDALVIVCIGLYLDLRAVLTVLCLSFLLASGWACYLLLAKRKSKGYAMPFVPFLAAASWIVVIGIG